MCCDRGWGIRHPHRCRPLGIAVEAGACLAVEQRATWATREGERGVGSISACRFGMISLLCDSPMERQLHRLRRLRTSAAPMK